MKYSIVFIVVSFVTIPVLKAQTLVTGKIQDTKNEPVAAASIKLKESGEGARSDSSGVYRLLTKEKGKKTIEVSSVGYGTRRLSIVLNDSVINLDIVLSNQAKQLGDVVVVSAGSFEASDKAKGASLTPMDAMTVAGNGGDISNSLRFLPGAQQIGEKEGLFVRGGTSEESKQFVDGTLIKNPNYPSVPGMIQPARVNPFLFKGILFNTGGYSALYGDALSSALILESVDLPDESVASLHIFPTSAGAGFQKLNKNKKSSYGVNTSYGSYALNNKVIKQRPDFFHAPEYLAADANFRIKTSNTGILKFYTNYGYNHAGMRNPDIDSLDLFSSFESKGSNAYANLSYSEFLGKQWKLNTGLAYNYSKQRINNILEDSSHQQVFIEELPYKQKNIRTDLLSHFAQARVVLTKSFSWKQTLRFGGEQFYSEDSYSPEDSLFRLTDNRTALFAETDLHIARDIAVKAGVRAEYSSLIKEMNIAPRISLAYRFKNGGQINMAYGIFYQNPELLYLISNKDLTYTQARHYILNYQKKANNRLLRVEAYYKQYRDLITTHALPANAGEGYAKGIDVFFRDKRTFKNFDYWISYSYLNTKRKFLNYPYSLRPEFTTPHTASIAIKRFFSDLNFNVNLAYAFATGRPYYGIQNVGNTSQLSDKGTTNMYNQMNLSFAYLFTLFKKWKQKDFSGIGFGISNVFGTNQIYGYRYSYNGMNKIPVTQPAARSFYIGIFMSFGIDRSDDFLNENL